MVEKVLYIVESSQNNVFRVLPRLERERKKDSPLFQCALIIFLFVRYFYERIYFVFKTGVDSKKGRFGSNEKQQSRVKSSTSIKHRNSTSMTNSFRYILFGLCCGVAEYSHKADLFKTI